MRDRLDSAKAARQTTNRPTPSPAERGERFVLPMLTHGSKGFFSVFDETPLLEADWEITSFDHRLTVGEFAQGIEAMRRARLSISELDEVECDVYDRLDSQLALFGKEDGWSVVELISWLDRNLPFPYATSPKK